ncbi:uncharacterized protein LOC135682225 [Rhopilema esculentum]|uniref:uncharacterized protein LOC135682225 n=1 Tax=Rhopilema esculentum TaxID=499914 RepID=UPI0031D9352B
MALSAQNDTGQSGAEEQKMVKKNALSAEVKSKHDSGICLETGMCFPPFEKMESMKVPGSVPISLAHSTPNSEENAPPLMDVQFTGHFDDENQPSKQHIAYHVLSNLLDDEINDGGAQHTAISKTELNDVFDAGSWPPSISSLSSSFSLNLDLHDNANQAGFPGRIIHDIWSPNPSPKGSYPSTPSEDSIPYFPSSHDNRESPYHNGSPVDLLMGRCSGSPMLASPCCLSSDQSFLSHNQRKETSPFYGSGYVSMDSFNNNHGVSNGFDNGLDIEHGKLQRQNMHAIRALQFADPGNDGQFGGQDSGGREPTPTGLSDDPHKHETRSRKHQVHFEEREKNGFVSKHKNGQVIPSREEMMSAGKRLGSGLDECLEQLRHLERECRKAEQELSKVYPSRRRSSSSGGGYHTRMSSNPTRVDKMIHEQIKVHDKVESLIGRIERLGRRPLHSNVGVALDKWLACIRELQNLRKNEINSSPGSHVGSYGCKSYDDRDLLALGSCIKSLVTHTREARTTVWCATQMLHAEDYWMMRPSESCTSLEHHSDLSSEKS